MKPEKSRVLVAEDNPVNFELVRDLLESLGHEVGWAKDGQHALDMAATGRFELLLLDLHSPKLDGLQVVRALRASPPSNHLKVFALPPPAIP